MEGQYKNEVVQRFGSASIVVMPSLFISGVWNLIIS